MLFVVIIIKIRFEICFVMIRLVIVKNNKYNF